MARVGMLGGRRIEQYNSPNAGGQMSDHRGVVLHIAEGSYRGTIAWQNNPDQRYGNGQSVTTCSTWIVGRELGEWAQMVDSDRIAWCQRGGSRTWLSIELAGYAPAAPTAWQIEACAQILAWDHRTHGVPITVADHPGERGLGHHSMDREWLGEEWGHDSCPGSGVIAAKSAIVARAHQILAGDDEGDDEMTPAQQWVLHVINYRTEALKANRPTIVIPARPDLGKQYVEIREANALAVAVAGLAGRDVDEQAIADAVLAGLGGKDLAEAATALRAALGDGRAAELGALLVATGGMTGSGSA